jgi:tetratricopeptide (TPR) repeat protein
MLAAISAGLLLIDFHGQQREPETRTEATDPRLTYTGPFRNVDPTVRYVSDSRCAECHEDIAASFALHPMGRSLLPAAEAVKPPVGTAQNNPFQAFGSRFQVEYQGDRTLHTRTRMSPTGQPAAELQWQVDYVLGSGTRGCSYLSERDGYLFQTPISWYAQKKPPAWDLSPGFGMSLLMGRAVLPDCLFCHANRANDVKDSMNRYARPVFDGHAIGCQRCHGPGELHVKPRGESSKPAGQGAALDPTIVNPKHLPPELRQAICEQCHLQGTARTVARGRELYDFRPGLPLESFWAVFLRGPEAGEQRKAVGQVEQMYESRCFQGGATPQAGQLGCVSCHDPHERVPPDRRIEHYRQRCLHCHREPEAAANEVTLQKGCSVQRADRLRQTEDSCIDCHMSRFGASDIPHTAVADHRILRNSKQPQRDERRAAGDSMPLVSFYRGRKGVDDAEDDRCRAVALMQLALMGDAAAAGTAGRVLPVLDAALRRDPGDLRAAEAQAYALGIQERTAEALAAFQSVLAQAPGREASLVGAATMMEALGRAEEALDLWRRVVVADPWVPGYRHRLVALLIKKEAWDEARPQCDAWVRLDPMSSEARATRILCLLAAGNKDEARAEFARIEALAPANLRELQIRFERKLR